MMIAFVESRPKKDEDAWEDVVLGRHEMEMPPLIGSVVRIPDEGGVVRRYRAREIVYDLPRADAGERFVERGVTVYLVPMPCYGPASQMVLAVPLAVLQEG